MTFSYNIIICIIYNFMGKFEKIKHKCGFLLQCKNKYLICHPYGAKWRSNYWTLPKGMKEIGETDKETAYRETKEETGLDLTKIDGDITKIDTYKYAGKNEKITIFLFKCNKDITKKKLECKSLIKYGEHKRKPEIDFFQWVSKKEAIDKLNDTQSQAIKAIK